jgi:hypothetical protein
LFWRHLSRGCPREFIGAMAVPAGRSPSFDIGEAVQDAPVAEPAPRRPIAALPPPLKRPAPQMVSLGKFRFSQVDFGIWHLLSLAAP